MDRSIYEEKDKLMERISKWHEEEQYQRIVDTIVKLAYLDLLPEDYSDEFMEELAVAYNNMKQYEKAIQVLENTSPTRQDTPKWHYRLGYALYRLGKYDRAKKSFKRSLSLNPTEEIKDECDMFLYAIHQEIEERDNMIKPFFWVEHSNTASVCLNVGEYLQDVFDTRANEGFEGGGYDWESLARVFLDECRSDLKGTIQMDSEGSMFVAYSEDKLALRDFILSFKDTCENKTLIMDLFSRAELD
ncbi:MAG: Imm51 family immunity protein [Anaeromicrobium sp.]|jgi:tetratricopeptide (TPR) repeat protein|uniref:Imm51 family immunity protein n=1 Tax=Anaeromicrobium sp. TaxID=1929132 RepID=UPI0025D1FBC2|nr:Imm51 family immunity protein [Anaeromicrobium sp.]MCT4595462.1 Imm51 family immunity protein [Anaeromicrobium sp.]